MLKLIGAVIAGMGILVIAVIAIFINGFKIQKDNEGKSNVSLFWGAIKVDEKNQKVNILGDLVAVDGKEQIVKVGNQVHIDGKQELVNVANGDILVLGKEKLVKVKKNIVSKVDSENVYIDASKFDSKLVRNILKINVNKDDVKIEGKVIDEDETYLHVEVKDKEDIKIEVKFES